MNVLLSASLDLNAEVKGASTSLCITIIINVTKCLLYPEILFVEIPTYVTIYTFLYYAFVLIIIHLFVEHFFPLNMFKITWTMMTLYIMQLKHKA